jgi:hypothetical protein
MTAMTLIAIGTAWSGLAAIACTLGAFAGRSDRRAPAPR